MLATLALDFASRGVLGCLAELVDAQLQPPLVDESARALVVDASHLPLTKLEFAVMRYLHDRRDEVVSRDDLLRDAWRQQTSWTRSSGPSGRSSARARDDRDSDGASCDPVAPPAPPLPDAERPPAPIEGRPPAAPASEASGAPTNPDEKWYTAAATAFARTAPSSRSYPSLTSDQYMAAVSEFPANRMVTVAAFANCKPLGRKSNTGEYATNPSGAAAPPRETAISTGFANAPGGMTMLTPSIATVPPAVEIVRVAVEESLLVVSFWPQPTNDVSVGGEVMQCAASGCNMHPVALATGQSFPEGIAVNDEFVFWSVQGDGTNVAEGTIMRCRLPDCAGGPRLFASGQHQPYGIVADERAVAWCNEGIGVLPNPNGSIAICSNLDAGCGSSPTVLYQTPALNPRRIAMDATSVYFTHYNASLDHADGRVFSCARSGCGGNAVVVAQGRAEPYDVAVGNGFVYFTNNSPHDPDFARGAFAEDVVKCPITGCSNGAIVVATSQGTPRGIAVDQNAVYWANDRLDAVMKVAK